MAERPMTEPVLPDRRRPTARRRKVVRRAVPVGAVAVAAVLVGVLPAVGAPAASPLQPAQQAAPGVDPQVQRWFTGRDAMQIELNNALQPAQKLPRPASAARPVCTRLLKAATLLSAYGRIPSAPLDVQVRAGLDTFVKAATTCLAGDLATAEQLVAQGLGERAAVSEQIDELLDGD